MLTLYFCGEGGDHREKELLGLARESEDKRAVINHDLMLRAAEFECTATYLIWVIWWGKYFGVL